MNIPQVIVNLPKEDNKTLIVTTIIGGIFVLLASIIPIILRRKK